MTTPKPKIGRPFDKRKKYSTRLEPAEAALFDELVGRLHSEAATLVRTAIMDFVSRNSIGVSHGPRR